MPPVTLVSILLPEAVEVVKMLANLMEQHHSGIEVTQDQVDQVMQARQDFNDQWASLAPKA